MADCRHNEITVFMALVDGHRMWACADCGIRFYPACPTCISVGHRGEVHIDILLAAAAVYAEETP